MNLTMAFAGVEARLVKACARAGRERAEVRLVAVSKLHPPEKIREAYGLGQRLFGENYAQDLRDKAQSLADLADLRWHAIGPVQPKNAKYVAKAASVFHALDRLDVAEELSRRRTGPPLQCLVQVNVTGEASKSGISPKGAKTLIEQVRALPNLVLVGLTTMPPLTDDPETSRAAFRALKMMAQGFGLPELSMGSTFDYEVAIEEGATLVRVGTALFGERT